jgi:hypothetical protein
MSFSGLEQIAIVWSDNFSKHNIEKKKGWVADNNLIRTFVKKQLLHILTFIVGCHSESKLRCAAMTFFFADRLDYIYIDNCSNNKLVVKARAKEMRTINFIEFNHSIANLYFSQYFALFLHTTKSIHSKNMC